MLCLQHEPALTPCGLALVAPARDSPSGVGSQTTCRANTVGSLPPHGNLRGRATKQSIPSRITLATRMTHELPDRRRTLLLGLSFPPVLGQLLISAQDPKEIMTVVTAICPTKVSSHSPVDGDSSPERCVTDDQRIVAAALNKRPSKSAARWSIRF